MKRVLLVVLIFFAGSVVSTYAFGWSLVKGTIRHQFPEVRRITTAQLAAWLENDSRPTPLLLDVRTEPEFAVSHLRNAERVSPDASADVVHVAKDRPIVTYCSVGYRSSEFARRLQQAGFTNVQNLEGSIFEWANEGRPVYRDGHRVEQVHPFNSVWGLLLAKKYHARVASP